MFNLSGRLSLAVVVMALALGGQMAHAQTAPVKYWNPFGAFGWPIGIDGNLNAGQDANTGANTYGNSFSFGDSDAFGNGFSYSRTNFPNGMFVSGQSTALGMNGFAQDAAFGTFSSLNSQGVQFGYNFQNEHGLPVTVYAGVDALKFNTPGIGAPFTSYDPLATTVSGYHAHAGVEFQAAPNVSLSLGVGYTELSRRTGTDSNSVAPSDAWSSAVDNLR